MQQLSGADASFLYFESPKSPGHVFTLWLYDPSTAPAGNVTFKAILEHYRQRLDVAKVFRQKLVRVPLGLDHPYWVDDEDFDLEFHVRHIALPKPGDWRQLCIQVARLHSRPLDPSRPLWEATVIEGLDNVEGFPPGSFAVMQKTHHAAVDGATMFEIISAIHDRTPDPGPRPATDDWRPERTPSGWQLLSRAGLNNVLRPFHSAQTLFRSQAPSIRRELGVPRMSPAPRTRFSGAVSGHLVVDARRFALDDLKRIKASVPGATINDVAIAIVGGALRTYLSDKGELPKESLRVMAPISLRAAGDAAAGGNQVSAMIASLATDVADARDRLAAVRSSTHASKQIAEATDARALSQLSELMPGRLTMMGARLATRFEVATRATPIVNTVVSNVPGPQVPLYLAGARLETMVSSAMISDGMGLFHGVLSYCGEVVITALSDRAMMPDPQFYATCLAESFDELLRATT